MSAYRVTFHARSTGLGEHWSGLAGPGSIRIESGALVLAGARTRTRAATRLGGAAAFVLFLLTLVGTVSASRVFATPVLPGLICVFIPIAVFILLRSMLARHLAPSHVEVSVPYACVVRVSLLANARRVEVLTAAPELSGLTSFTIETGEIAQFFDEIAFARGALHGYREAP